LDLKYVITNSHNSVRIQPAHIRCPRYRVVGVGIPRPPQLDALLQQYPPEARARGQLVYLGRIQREKGVHDIIRALDLLVHRYALTDARLDVVGYANDLDYLEELKQLVRQTGLEGRVTFAGNVSEEEKLRHLCQAGLMVFASTWQEGHGQTYLEAMMCRTPCVCSPAGGAAEVLVDEANCLLFQGGDPESLAQAAYRMIQDAALRERIVETAARMVAETYSVERFAQRCEEALEDCVTLYRAGTSP
jgi:glycosyltransferase involved in cell wall biosynthesis